MIRIFVSSVQKELAEERRAVKDFIQSAVAHRDYRNTDMISDCLAVGLPEPSFEQNGAHFATTIWRDWLTDAIMDELGLNERQTKGGGAVQENRPHNQHGVSDPARSLTSYSKQRWR